jgi:hypothetical protein
MGTDGENGWIKASMVKVVGFGTFSEGSGRSSYMGSNEVGWDGTVVSCESDGDFSVMTIVWEVEFVLGSYVMLIIV